MLIVGLMSGTSLDGVDAALVEIVGDSVESLRWNLVRSMTVPYEPDRRGRIHDAIIGGKAAEISALHADLGEWFAEAAHAVCRLADVPLSNVDLIGSHGQTIWHQPPVDGERGSTLQIGCAATIAERTGVAVVSDFRSRDLAAGGHGAPLVPWVDRVLFSLPDRVRALQNLGGVANVTRVPMRGSSEPLIAFDTGPGNALIDAAVAMATGGRMAFDANGSLASRGIVDDALLQELLRHPYFALEPPKSTGREIFGRPFVERLVQAVEPEGDDDWLDLVATLTELTARTVAEAYQRWLIPSGLDEVVVTGGGAYNTTLVKRIAELLAPVQVMGPRALGIGPNDKEALAFAVLAWAYDAGIPANEPSATGASGPRVLGSYTPGTRTAKEVTT